MADIKYTKMQQAAIDLRDKNILVSAAAGSGKTAVLVKRIIDRVLDENDPVDIDRILVMTFTRAAAQQMKEKIMQAIDEKKSEKPHDKNLQRQYALIHNASIMTIDSFCLNVVRNHFEEINLSPDFRMADEGEVKLLMQDVLGKLLEDMYETGDKAFLDMTEAFAAGKSDSKIESIIFNLYEHSQSYPYPYEWLKECDKEYRDMCLKVCDVLDLKENSGLLKENSKLKDAMSVEDFGFIDKIPWIDSYVNSILDKLKNIRNEMSICINECNASFGPKQYEEAIKSDIELVDKLLKASKYTELFTVVSGLGEYQFQALSRASYYKKGDLSESDEQVVSYKKDEVKASRDAYKKELQGILDAVMSQSPAEIVIGMQMMAENVKTLIDVTKRFSELLSEEKRTKNIVDFNDLEHFCLDILKLGKDTTAKEYSQFYKEIYVDEYQDSNLCQEEILKYMTDENLDKGKLFMVGDNKQSIYGFRLARPQIFIDKYNSFSDIDEKDGKRDIKIDLSDNFRSRTEIINTVNSIFSKIMRRNIGGIEYNSRAALNYGASYEELNVDNKSELLLIRKDEDISTTEAEAYLTASRIKHLMKDFIVSEGNSSRRLKYSDIVILMRSPKGRDTVFMNILENEGIPVHITSSQGYFSAAEIVVLLDYLKIIDNPLQDIPLAAVMLSVLGGFTEEELAIIRGAFKNGYLYNACLSYVETYNDDNSENAGLIARLTGFISDINYYRKKSEYSSVEEILTEIIDKDYGNYVRAMPGGTKKYANLNMLITKAKEYGKTSFKGIFHFNRYIEALKKYDIDYGEANILDENDNTVRIMSIHKSKGLEFPVCFVCGVNNKLNLKDAESSMIIDNDYGFSTDVFDVNKRIKAKSLFRLSMAEKKKLEMLAEELRLLYVAMTRAKEKLILTGCIGDVDEIDKGIKTVPGARAYLDLIKYAIAKNRDDNEHNVDVSANPESFNINISTVQDIVTDKTISDAEGIKLKEKLLYMIQHPEEAEFTEHIKEIKQRIDYVYPYKDNGTAVKMSVSELKHMSDSVDIKDEMLNDENTAPYNTSSKSFGALHGSAVHRIFELWDYNRENTVASVRDFLDHVKTERLMEDDLYETLNIDEITAFVQSDIASRMKKAYQKGLLRREQPFVISVDEDDPESMLVQGIIDAYFIEDDQIVLIDYKTDKNKTEQMLINDHKTQLVYYGIALERMLDMKIKEKVIYSTELGKSIII